MYKEAKASFFIYKKVRAEESARFILKFAISTFAPACAIFFK